MLSVSMMDTGDSNERRREGRSQSTQPTTGFIAIECVFDNNTLVLFRVQHQDRNS
jgi:hypothetical protein